eukprot:gene31611-62394_t
MFMLTRMRPIDAWLVPSADGGEVVVVEEVRARVREGQLETSIEMEEDVLDRSSQADEVAMESRRMREWFHAALRGAPAALT